MDSSKSEYNFLTLDDSESQVSLPAYIMKASTSISGNAPASSHLQESSKQKSCRICQGDMISLKHQTTHEVELGFALRGGLEKTKFWSVMPY